MSASSLRVGRFTTGQYDRIEAPRLRSRSRPFLLVAPGNFTALLGDTWITQGPAIRAAGWRTYQPSVPLLVGNATSTARMADAVTGAVADGAAAVPPLIIGASNGATAALQYAVAHDVAGLVLMLPAIDMAYIYANDVGGFRSDIEAAWGITYPAPLPDAANPLWLAEQGAFDGVPMQVWYASNDPISIGDGTAVASFQAAVPEAEIGDVGALGHSFAACQAVPDSTVIAFAQAHT